MAAPDTINTMPAKTLLAFADHGELHGVMPVNGDDALATLGQITKAGVIIEALATTLQDEGTKAFVKPWRELMARIAGKTGAPQANYLPFHDELPPNSPRVRNGMRHR